MTGMYYSESLYDSRTLRKYARKFLKVLPENVTMLVSKGSSGCAIASAMLALSRGKLAHTQYRKGSEGAHSTHRIGMLRDYIPPAVMLELPNVKVAIVDDILDSGETVFSLINECESDELSIEAIIVGMTYDSVRPDYSSIYDYNIIDLGSI